MFRRVQKIKNRLTALIWVLGIQFLLFPFFHFHPDMVHGHTGDLSPHRHGGHFHSPELENLVRGGHFHDKEAGHTHHPLDHQGEEHFKIDINKETLNPQKPIKVLKVSADFPVTQDRHQFTQAGPVALPPDTVSRFAVSYRLRERSPPL
ncbi:MAG: hypothetical protein G3M78_01880 [Candidatus Nitrohelix vancouverensis]|uniref:Uncharacterized protein n=1 Tax=Candidatus Nitrohelix vancouverensis TaxID=2705534 RepID=A0A7T0C0B1_9BACT|nr:MAG: hypothetical protein G3M78_01880 [Candidatus Nitrohelix vancouverensis]